MNQKLDLTQGRFYNRLFNDRMTGDYDDFVTFDRETIDEILPKSIEFVRAIHNLI